MCIFVHFGLLYILLPFFWCFGTVLVIVSFSLRYYLCHSVFFTLLFISHSQASSGREGVQGSICFSFSFFIVCNCSAVQRISAFLRPCFRLKKIFMSKKFS